MVEEGLVSGAALPNGAAGCFVVDGVVVVVGGAMEERRWVLEQTRPEEEQRSC